MLESHWDENAAFIQFEDKVSLGFVEGLNNKIRFIQRRAYELRSEDYLPFEGIITGSIKQFTFSL